MKKWEDLTKNFFWITSVVTNALREEMGVRRRRQQHHRKGKFVLDMLNLIYLWHVQGERIICRLDI